MNLTYGEVIMRHQSDAEAELRPEFSPSWRQVCEITPPLIVFAMMGVITAVVQVGLVSKEGPHAIQASLFVDYNLSMVGSLSQFVVQAQPYFSAEYASMHQSEKTRQWQPSMPALVKDAQSLAFAIGLLGTVYMPFSGLVASYIGYRSEVAQIIKDICIPLAFAVIFQMHNLVSQQLVQTTKHTKSLYPIAFASMLFSCVANYILIPHFGVTTIGYVGTARIFMTWLLFRKYFQRTDLLKDFYPRLLSLRVSAESLKQMKKILIESAPISAQSFAINLSGLMVTSLAQRQGGDRAEVLQVALLMYTISSLISQSLATASGVLVSRYGLDKTRSSELQRITNQIILVSILIVSLLSIPMVTTPTQLCSTLGNVTKFSTETIDHLPAAMGLYALRNTMQIAEFGFLQHLENAHHTFLPGMISASLALLTYLVASVAVHKHAGLVGIAASEATGKGVSASLLCGLWYSRKTKADDNTQVINSIESIDSTSQEEPLLLSNQAIKN